MASQRKLTLNGPAGKLQAMLHLPDTPPAAIAIVAHPLPIMGGTMDNKVVTTLSKTFVELGWATLRFNFRGVGDSEGKYDQGQGEIQDVISATLFMRHSYPALPLVSAGFSFGGYVQACAAEQLRPDKLVLIAPAVGRFAMPEVAANSLIIHGDKDDVVSIQDVFAWAAPQQLPITVLSGAEHFFHGRLMQLKQVLKQQLETAYPKPAIV